MSLSFSEYAPQAQRGLLSYFWELSNTDEGKRLDATKHLLEFLDSSLEQESNIEYTLKRLIKGLSSNHKGARQGFAMALTEFLRRYPPRDVATLFAIANKHLKAAGGAKAEEERGCAIGYVFFLLSLFRSRALNEEGYVMSLKKLHEFSKGKIYLKEICAVAVGDAISQCCELISFEEHLMKIFSEELTGGWSTCTAEILQLLLIIKSTFSQIPKVSSFLKQYWGHEKVIHKSTIDQVVKVLLNSTHSHPNIHAVWKLVFQTVLKSRKLFSNFWITVVDDGLCCSSHERKYLAFQLLTEIFPGLPPDQVNVVLSPNLIGVLMNHLRIEENYLHSAAKHLVDLLIRNVSQTENKAALVALIIHLKGNDQTQNFDEVTETKTMKTLISLLDEEGLEIYVKQLGRKLLECSKSESDSLVQRQLRIVDQFLHIIRNTSFKRIHTSRTVLLCMVYLMTVAFFRALPQDDTQGLISIPLKKEVINVAQQRFLSSCYEVLVRARSFGQDFKPMTELATVAKEYVASGYSREWEEESQQAWQQVDRLLQCLHKLPSAGVYGGFEMLVCYSALRMFVNESSATAQLNELSTLFRSVKNSLDNVSPKEDPSDRMVGWHAILMDILLEILSHSTNLAKEVVKQVFKMTMEHMTKESLDILTKMLDPNKDSELHKHLKYSSDESSDEDESIDTESDSEADSISIIPNGNNEPDLGEGITVKNWGQPEESSDSGDSDGDSKEDEDKVREDVVPDEAIEEFKILQREDHEDDSESELDDDQMLAMDSALADAFKARVSSLASRKKHKDYEEQVMHFRLKVLSLMESYLKRYPNSPLVVECVLPLMEQCLQKGQLQARSMIACDKLIFKAKKIPKESIDIEIMFYIMKRLIMMFSKASVSIEVKDVLVNGMMWCLKLSKRAERPQNRKENALETTEYFVEHIHNLLKEQILQFGLNKSCPIPMRFFEALIERQPDTSCLLHSEFIDAAVKATHSYRKMQCYVLLGKLLNNFQKSSDVTGMPLLLEDIKNVIEHLLDSQTFNKAQRRLIHQILDTWKVLVDRVSLEEKSTIQSTCRVTLERLMKHLKKINHQQFLQIAEGIAKKLDKVDENSDIPKSKKRKHK